MKTKTGNAGNGEVKDTPEKIAGKDCAWAQSTTANAEDGANEKSSTDTETSINEDPESERSKAESAGDVQENGEPMENRTTPASEGESAAADKAPDSKDGTAAGTSTTAVKSTRDARKQMYPNFTDLLLTIGVFVVSLFIAAAGMLLLNAFNAEKELVVAVVYPLQFIPVIIFLRYYRRSRGDNSPGAQLAPKSVNLPLTLWGILLVFVMSFVLEPLLSLFPARYFEQIEEMVGRGGWTILTTVIMAPVLEETLFRGQVFGAVKKKYGSFRALVISSFLFAVIHGNPPQMVNAFFIGLILGYVYLKTGSLLSVMIIHAVNNGFAYLEMEAMADLERTATMREAVGNDTLYYIIYGVCVAVLALGIMGTARTIKRQKLAAAAKDEAGKRAAEKGRP